MKNAFYFTADWCGPCKKVKPIVEEINRESVGLKFQIIDADSNLELINNFQVKSIPTFILVEDGIVKNRITGAQSQETLENFLKDE